MTNLIRIKETGTWTASNGTIAPTTVYTVPAGKTLIVSNFSWATIVPGATGLNQVTPRTGVITLDGNPIWEAGASPDYDFGTPKGMVFEGGDVIGLLWRQENTWEYGYNLSGELVDTASTNLTRTKLLGTWSGVTSSPVGPSTVYTVPAGKKFIVTNYTWATIVPGATGLNQVSPRVGAVTLDGNPILELAASADTEWGTPKGMVFEAGDVIGLLWRQENTWIYGLNLSGELLDA